MTRLKTWLPVTLPLVVVAVSLLVLLLRLGEPARIIFDETYYVNDARDYLTHGVESSFAVHPPVGKWLIAAGIEVAGDRAFGWRIAGAVAGAATVLLTYLIGHRLLARRGLAALAALLLLTDGLFFVQSRTSMLDVFLAFFVVLAAYLLLRDHQEQGRADPDRPPTAVRPLRVLAGVVFGLAIATKWSALLALGAGGLLVVGLELAERRRVGLSVWAGWRRLVASLAVAFVLAPAGVYLVSYVPWLVNYAHTTEGKDECPEASEAGEPCGVGVPGRLAGLWREHVEIWRFHTDLEASHSYRAPAYTWPVMARPVVYYYESCDEERANASASVGEDGTTVEPEPCVVEPGQAAEIIALGNPALWWGFLLAAPLLVGGVGWRDRRAVALSTFWLLQFVPWLVVSRPVFFFYMVPVVPFLALGVAYAVWVLAGSRPVRWQVGLTVGVGIVGALVGALLRGAFGGGIALLWGGLGIGALVGAAVGGALDRRSGALRWRRHRPLVVGGAIGAIALALFLYFYPVWTGIPLDDDAIRQRWWFDSWI